MIQKNVVIIHYNTPELTEACILSLRKHGGNGYKVHILDNSDSRPFKKRMKGVKVWNNRDGQIIDLKKELEKYPQKNEKIGCAKGCYYGSDVHMMSVQKMFELVPDGFVLLDSDILIRRNIDYLYDDRYCTVGYITNCKGYYVRPRLMPMLLYINVPKCVAGGARFFDPNRSWALHPYYSQKNWWDTGATILDDVKRLKPQCKGYAITREQFASTIVHFGSGSWAKNDINTQIEWLNQHMDLWQ